MGVPERGAGSGAPSTAVASENPAAAGSAAGAAPAGVATPAEGEGTGGALNIAGVMEVPAASGPGAAGQGMAVANPEPGQVVITPSEGIWTSVRGQANAPVFAFQINNPGPAALAVEAIEVSGSELFVITDAPTLPLTLQPGASVTVSVQLVTAVNALPAAPAQDSGSTVAAGALSVTVGAASVQARLHGIILTRAIWEPTFGQVIDALGYDINIGDRLRTSANPETMPGVEAGTDEIDAPLFVRAGSGAVTLKPVARFSPLGVMPFGFYTPGNANARSEVGAMAEQNDPHTSNKARLLLPPMTGDALFDPGPAPFGIWAFTNQVAEGNAQHGNNLFTEDALNVTGGLHRVKVYPLEDASGTRIDNSFLLACEEAANGDYQDYVFVLSNVAVAP
jgi:hypothetical protein